MRRLFVAIPLVVISVPTHAQQWTPPKTPWGEPDLQGMWPLDHLITTPLVRRGQYGDRRFLTEEEHAAAQKAAATRVQ